MTEAVPFAVSPSSGTPIYQQIVTQAEALIAAGVLREGDLLPSVRTVAAALAINPMTVSRAYSELEAAGLAERLRGRGMKVCGSAVPVGQRREQIAQLAGELARLSVQLGLAQTHVLDVVRDAYRAAASE